MLLTVSLLGRVAGIHLFKDYLSECYLDISYTITRWPSNLRAYEGVRENTTGKVSLYIGIESFLKVCSLRYIGVSTGNE